MKLFSTALCVALLFCAGQSAALCPRIAPAMGEAASENYPANRVCLPASPQATSVLAYSQYGELYNNSTTVTPAAICDLPVASGRPLKTITAIVEKFNLGENDQATSCTLRAYNSDFSVVYSDSISGNCNAGLFVTNLNGAYLTANVRCGFNPRVGSSYAQVNSIYTLVYEP